MEHKHFKISQYACAALLIVSSIAMVAYQVVNINDVAAGLLYYVAQSFLLAGSIFGLDQYIRIIKKQRRPCRFLLKALSVWGCQPIPGE